MSALLDTSGCTAPKGECGHIKAIHICDFVTGFEKTVPKGTRGEIQTTEATLMQVLSRHTKCIDGQVCFYR